jgi:hypothetical protein
MGKEKYRIECADFLAGVGYGISQRVNFLLKEAEIARMLEKMLSNYLKNTIDSNLWISRFNAKELGQDAFYIYLNHNYGSYIVGEGKILEKRIKIRKRNESPKSVIQQLKDFFKHLGFTIEE